MEKLSQEQFIEKALSRAKRDIDLSRFLYQGSAVKGTAVCPTHGEFQITPNALMNRVGCAKCGLIDRAAKRTMGFEEFLIKANNKHGSKYTYFVETYRNSQSKVTISCPIHGEFTQQANAHLRGQGCPKCGDIRIGDLCRLSYNEFITRAKAIHGNKYDLSKIEYRKQSSKITVICKEHGPFYPQAGNFISRASGCPECGKISVGLKTRKPSDYYMRKAIDVHGKKYTYLGIEYSDTKAYLKISCPEHGEFIQLAQDHIRGVGCQKCAYNVYDQESFIKEAVLSHGNRYDYSQSIYTGALSKIKIICPEHGEFEQAPTYHVNAKQGCPRCGGTGPSNGQVEILEFVGGYIPATSEASLDDSRRRLDIYIPTLNLAIEYHGLIWHSTAFSQDPTRDYKKHLWAKELGVRVIHIYQDEWQNCKEIVKRTILAAIGKLPRVFARKTRIALVPVHEAAQFFDRNHLQGSTNTKLAIGLYKEDSLIACMSFAVARSTRTNRDPRLWELQRYASTCAVVGGASKILKQFLSQGLCHTLISYSDTRLFTGNMYKALGFTLAHETPPDYSYVTTSIKDGRTHKSKFQLKHLPKKLKDFDPEKSEAKNCFDNGWYQLFDCGKKKWILECE